MDFRDLRNMKAPQMGKSVVNLEGTTMRTRIDKGKVLIENVAYDKEGKEIVVRTVTETIEGLKARKDLLITQKESLAKKIDTEIAKIDEVLEANEKTS